LAGHIESAIERYSDGELVLIADYLETMSAMTERLMADTIAARSSA
jgi:hypothetical protein